MTALVREALDELAAMPAEQAREVVGNLVQLSGHAEGRSSGVATLTVKTVRAEAVVAEGRPAVSALVRVATHPVLGPLLVAYVGTTLGNLTSDSVKAALAKLLPLLAAGQLAVGQPGAAGAEAKVAEPAVVQQHPAPQQPPPPGAVFLPSHEPPKK